MMTAINGQYNFDDDGADGAADDDEDGEDDDDPDLYSASWLLSRSFTTASLRFSLDIFIMIIIVMLT